jgi:hypothetical protein
MAALARSARRSGSGATFEGSIALSFDEPAAAGAEIVTRSHPIPATLAESLLESALDPGSAPISPLGRTGAWPTAAVKSVTTVFLLRLRYKLTVHGRRERLLLVEEAGAAAFEATRSEAIATGGTAQALLDHPATGDLAAIARQRILAQARDRAALILDDAIADYARRRSAELAQDHARVRAAGAGVPRVTVEPVLPPDVIGLYVLLPANA